MPNRHMREARLIHLSLFKAGTHRPQYSAVLTKSARLILNESSRVHFLPPNVTHLLNALNLGEQK
jgi:hypothetical protein